MHTHHLLQMELKTLNDVNLNPKKKKGNCLNYTEEYYIKCVVKSFYWSVYIQTLNIIETFKNDVE